VIAAPAERPIFLYDGDCGVCDNGTASIRRRINPPVDLVTYQSRDTDALGISELELLEGPVFVRTDGTHIVGPLAMGELLATARRPYRTYGRIMLAPGVRHVLHALGPWIYRQRHRLPGATHSCSVNAPARHH
jgi:predicted DCC family thiol-disulfide oxidoreductase YuxK